MFSIIKWYCEHNGIDLTSGTAFFTKLQLEAFDYRHELLSEVPTACQRLWTSAKTLCDGREFCSIVNEAIRADEEVVMKDLAMFVRGMNELCVVRPGASGNVRKGVVWPKDHILYRGGGLPDEHQGELRIPPAI
jgi:hypothetical protein